MANLDQGGFLANLFSLEIEIDLYCVPRRNLMEVLE
jgi:hypothetical protein